MGLAKYYNQPCFLWRNCINNDEQIVVSHISNGEQSLWDSLSLSPADRDLKIKGMNSYKYRNFDDAYTNLYNKLRFEAEKTFKNNPDPKQKEKQTQKSDALKVLKDPEILIFANNAKANLNKSKDKPLYKIAAVVPTIGKENKVGQHFLFGIAQAQDEIINSGQLNLQIEIANNENDPEISKAVANSLVKDSSVLGVVGHYFSSVTCETLKQVYNSNDLTVISPGSRESTLIDRCGKKKFFFLPANDVFFRTSNSTKAEAKSLVDYLNNKYYKARSFNVIVFYEKKDPYSNAAFDNFQTTLKNNNSGKISKYYEELPEKDTQDNQHDTNIINDSDAIVVFPKAQEVSYDKALEIIKKYGKNKLILAGNTLYFYDLLEFSQNNKIPPENLVIAVDWHEGQPEAKQFAEKAREKWGGDVNFRTALAYEATQVFIQALKDNKLKFDDRLGLKQIISSSRFESGVFTGKKISFDEHGDRKENTNACVSPTKNSDSDKQPKYKYLGDCATVSK